MHEGRFARAAGTLLVALLFGACGSNDSDSRWEMPPELLAPTIVSFDADPGTITANAPAVLSWQTRNVVSLALVDGAGARISLEEIPIEAGSIAVVPSATTTYTLTATGVDGLSTSRTVKVIVHDEPLVLPVVERFAATPEVVDIGAQTTLSWKTTGATTVTIKDDAGVEVDGNAVAEGQIYVKPTRSPTVYDLTASGPGGRATARTSVTVSGLPRVVRFDVGPPVPIEVGGTVALSWETVNATRVVIRQDDGVIVDTITELTGSLPVELSEGAVFTLQATSATGAAEARAEAKVGPRILAFSASDRLVRNGDTVTFTWQLADADRATIDGPGFSLELAASELISGTHTRAVTERGDYVLRAFRRDVPRTATAPIDVTVAPRIRALSVDRPRVTAAADHPAAVELSWRQDGAVRCTIYVNNQPATNLTDFTCANIGSAAVPVTATSSIRLEAMNDDGSHASTLRVDACEPARIVSFAAAPNRRLGPGDPVTLNWNVTDAVSVSMEKNDAAFEIDAYAFAGTAPDRAYIDSEYRLTAVNSLNDATHATVEVRVGAPAILDARATPDFVATGAPFVLGWRVDGGDTLTVEDPAGAELFRIEETARIDSGFSEALFAPVIEGVYQYKVTAKNGAGSTSAIAKVTASDGPMILSFTVDRSEISFGESMTFSWRVSDDQYGNKPTLFLRDDYDHVYTEIDGKDPNNGSVTIEPAAENPYVFTLIASTDGRIPARASVPVDVSIAPVLAEFGASPEMIGTNAGQEAPDVTLAWQSQHAVELTLSTIDAAGNPTPFLLVSLANGDAQADIDAGSILVHPTVTTWYLARIRNRLGTVVEHKVRVVVDPPEVLSFEASSLDLLEGEPVDLTWTTRHATSVTLDPVLEYVDISNKPYAAKGNLVSAMSLATIPFPAGFVFPFEGKDRTAMQAASIGFLGFNTSNAMPVGVTPSFPNSFGGFVNFALLGCALDPGLGSPAGELWYGLTADAFGPMFVVQYKNWAWSTTTYNPSNLNFELVLRPDGRFEYRYGEMTAKAGYENRAKGEGCQIGYQGTTGAWPWELFVPYQQPLASGLAYKSFVRPSLPALPTNHTRTMAPPRTTTYTLTATNADAEAVARATVTVWKRPTITPRVTPLAPLATQPLAISWTTTDANGVRVLDDTGKLVCEVTDPAKVAAGSCTRVEPIAGLKTFTIETMTGPPGAPMVMTTTFHVMVYSYLAITSLAVSPDPFPEAGDTVTVSWNTVGAYRIHLFACPPGSPDPLTCPEVTPPNAVPGAGSLAHEITDSMEFWAAAYDTQGREVLASQGVWVGAGTLDRFSASSTQIPLGGSTTLSWNSSDQEMAYFTRSGGVEVTATAPYVDITKTGTAAALADGDSNSGFFDVDFPDDFRFPWFGEPKEALRASTDGWITFDTGYATTHASPSKLPTAAASKAIQLAPFWYNLTRGVDGALRYELFEPPGGERCLIVQWSGFEFSSSSLNPANLNFQVVLFENGTVDFRYGTMRGTVLAGLADGLVSAMGWQSPDLTQAEMVSPFGTPMPGGLGSRSWRFPIQLTPKLAPDGSLSVTPAESTTYRLCATNSSGYEACEEVRVVVIQPGDLLFSELMIAPASAEAEWLELRNMSPDAIDLKDWVLSSGSEKYPIPTSVEVQPGGHAVFARRGEPAINGGLANPHVYGSTITLENDADGVTLSMGTLTVDQVFWDTSWPIQPNRSIAMEPTSMTRGQTCNDLPVTWCATTAVYGNGDYGGTPGTAGGCPTAP